MTAGAIGGKRFSWTTPIAMGRSRRGLELTIDTPVYVAGVPYEILGNLFDDGAMSRKSKTGLCHRVNQRRFGPTEGGPESPGGPPGYDANGNLKVYGDWTYSYDAQNRLRTASNNGTLIATYYYDGKNRQVARKLNEDVRFSVWDGWELIEEYAFGTTTPAITYLQGATGVIKSWGTNGTIYYYQDKLGSTTHVANANGTLLESFHYDLYGKPTETSAYGVVDLYAGERWISTLGLYDLRNRFMSSELGRFLQADPIGFQIEGEKPSAQAAAFFWAGQAPEKFSSSESNLYRYCDNDPVNRGDPFGLTPLAPGLLDVKEEVFKQTYDNVREAARLSKTDSDRLTGGRKATEFRIDTYFKGGELKSTKPEKGYNSPSPFTNAPKLPDGVSEKARASQGHSHVGTPGKHYGMDKQGANDAGPGGGARPLISGVGSTLDGRKLQEFYVPSANAADRAANRGGGYFLTRDGMNFEPAPCH